MVKSKDSKAKLLAKENSHLSLARHQDHCTICSHPQRLLIEQEWIAWAHTSRLARQYHVSRDSIYRHAHALSLFSKRQRNVRKALERIIEQAETVVVTASSVVAAIQAYAKINSSGQWIERVETVNAHDLFERMTNEELDEYAKHGSLPDRLTEMVNATPGGKGDGEDES